MAKKKPKAGDPKRILRFNRFFAANLVLEILGLLEDHEREYMDGGANAYGIRDWRARARKWLADRFGLDGLDFFRTLYVLCLDHMPETEAEAFIVRALECPTPSDLVLLREEFITGQF